MKLVTAHVLLIVFTITISACSSVSVKSAQEVPIAQEMQDIAEAELLDIGIKIFKPGLEQVDDDDSDKIIFPEIRIAESSYFPYLLMEAVQSSNAWGAVRVIPRDHDSTDVTVQGRIIASNGETLILDIDVNDASGRHWFTKRYSHASSIYAYQDKAQLRKEPFQTVYNQIANDLNNYRKKLSSIELIELRQIAELRFAKSLAPSVYAQHLAKEKTGLYGVKRLPASNDPMLNRIRQIRERDDLFVDTLQQYYDSYVKEMKRPYQQWRQESYQEVVAMDKLKRQAFREKAAGTLAIIAGILGVRSSDASVRAASAIAVTGGGYVIKSGFDRDADSQIHIETLLELGDSLEASIAPHVIELEDRTVTLTGTVNNQYQQWRKILQQLYQLDTGNIETTK